MRLERGDLDPARGLDADVCIVGAGAAGIALARALSGKGLDVLLLEGGGYRPTTRSQELYRAEMVTTYRGPRDESYPFESRLRYFGGTTNHWSGWCRPLEPWDFEARDWVPHSGWPFGLEELRPWYERAMPVLGISHWEAMAGPAGGAEAGRVHPPPSPRLESRTFHCGAPPRVADAYGPELHRARDLRVLVEANVLRLRAAGSGRAVERAEVQLEDGPRLDVRARHFVLACGGIENPRILLLSDREDPRGLGNAHDLVGRYFMEHPHDSRAGWLVFVEGEANAAVTRYYMERPRREGTDMRTMNVWITPFEVQRRERLLNFSLQARDPEKVELDALGGAVEATSGTLRAWDAPDTRDAPRVAAMLWTRSENAPHPDSRVTLGTERDRLGLRVARLDWKLREVEARSVRRSFEIFCHEFAAAAGGRARIRVDPERPFATTWGASHHMGTTRMHADPRHGVVDPDCRVHGLANLWIAGSSVFPTSGVANPTFTLVALALRLAERLRAEHAA